MGRYLGGGWWLEFRDSREKVCANSVVLFLDRYCAVLVVFLGNVGVGH